MLNGNTNKEELLTTDLPKENSSEENLQDLVVNSQEDIIEELTNDEVKFTPIVSDNIFEEENLDLLDSNDDSLELPKDDEDNEIVPLVENLNNHEVDFIDETINNEDVSFDETINTEEVSLVNDINNVVNTDINNDEKAVVNDNSNLKEQEIHEVIDDEPLQENIKDIKVENNLQIDKVENVKSETLLDKYGENFSVKEYVCNPAIGRDNEIKQLILTLLTPEKSGILVGKPGIGKTAIVEGLGYQIQKGNVPDALKDYQIYKLNTSSLLGVMPGTNEPKIQVLLNEIKGKQKLILFIDEIHTLIGAGADGDDSLDFANIFKPGLDRGNIKIIGATTSDEYDKYILTDKAFVRRFQKIDVLEPTKEHTVKIMMGSLPKLEHKTGAKIKYNEFIQEKIMTFIVDLTTEYRRVYELSARYPDVSLTILQQAFSYAVFDNKKEVSIRDIRKAICNTKLVYPDVIKKELVRFNEIFSDIYLMETPQRLKGETSI